MGFPVNSSPAPNIIGVTMQIALIVANVLFLIIIRRGLLLCLKCDQPHWPGLTFSHSRQSF